MQKIIKLLFILLVVKPFVLLFLGLNIVNRRKINSIGPNIIVANHNSHLDTMVLLSLFPLSYVHNVRPVAAHDYFFKNKLLAWFSLNCLGVIPIKRGKASSVDSIFSQCHKALSEGETLIIFPEGTRGDPESVSKIKKGVYYLVKNRDDVSVIPVVMHGLGKSLPKGEALFVPFNCDVIIGEPLEKLISSTHFVQQLQEQFSIMLEQCVTRNDKMCQAD